jgi:hypothetical protein
VSVGPVMKFCYITWDFTDETVEKFVCFHGFLHVYLHMSRSLGFIFLLIEGANVRCCAMDILRKWVIL